MFGAANNSHHESYAVILEEYQEAQEEESTFLSQLINFWQCVKQNRADAAFVWLELMQCSAEKIAAEWIQVAAMCHKAKKTKTM